MLSAARRRHASYSCQSAGFERLFKDGSLFLRSLFQRWSWRQQQKSEHIRGAVSSMSDNPVRRDKSASSEGQTCIITLSRMHTIHMFKSSPRIETFGFLSDRSVRHMIDFSHKGALAYLTFFADELLGLIHTQLKPFQNSLKIIRHDS